MLEGTTANVLEGKAAALRQTSQQVMLAECIMRSLLACCWPLHLMLCSTRPAAESLETQLVRSCLGW